MCKNKTVFIKSHSQVKAPHSILQILIMNIHSLTHRRECYQSHPPPPWSQIRPTVMTSYYHNLFLSHCARKLPRDDRRIEITTA